MDAIEIESYAGIIGQSQVERLKSLASPLQDKSWGHINSTFVGGGVAEMLKSVVPIAKGLGIDTRWYCMEGNDDFYGVTKGFHNSIQGVAHNFTLEDLLETYIRTNIENFEQQEINEDFTIVHDPQPIASIVHGQFSGKVLWRCHIDTTEADERIWNFLLPYINNYDGAIVSMEEFLREGIKKPVFQIVPAIDPLNEKNRQRTRHDSLDTLGELFDTHQIDAERPIVLAVSRYDIHKNQKIIIHAFRKLKQDPEIMKQNPQLIMVGNLADDDPEGQEMFESILEIIDGDPDIYPLLNIPNNDENIGALMHLADVFIHVSTREGFGLVVTEALWQGTPVIGSKVGGIKLQVLDHETGYLVEPNDVDAIAAYARDVLTDREKRDQMGMQAIEHVRDNFLMTTLVEKYLLLMRDYLDLNVPYFRLN
jgi:trehalose synthase